MDTHGVNIIFLLCIIFILKVLKVYLRSLEELRLINDFCLFYKCLNGFADFNLLDKFQPFTVGYIQLYLLKLNITILFHLICCSYSLNIL